MSAFYEGGVGRHQSGIHIVGRRGDIDGQVETTFIHARIELIDVGGDQFIFATSQFQQALSFESSGPGWHAACDLVHPFRSSAGWLGAGRCRCDPAVGRGHRHPGPGPGVRASRSVLRSTMAVLGSVRTCSRAAARAWLTSLRTISVFSRRCFGGLDRAVRWRLRSAQTLRRKGSPEASAGDGTCFRNQPQGRLILDHQGLRIRFLVQDVPQGHSLWIARIARIASSASSLAPARLPLWSA